MDSKPDKGLSHDLSINIVTTKASYEVEKKKYK